jgi:hypothetical protein
MTDEELQAAALEAERLEKIAADKEAADKSKEGEKPKDDKNPKLTDSEAKLLKEVMAQKKAAKEATDKAKALEDRYAGIDIDKLLEAAQKAEDAENDRLKREGDYERLLQKTREAHEREVNETKLKLKELTDAAKASRKEAEAATVINAFASSRYVLDNLTLTANKTKALYGDYFDTVDGVLVGFDKPKGSPNRTKLVDGSGDAVSFDEAMKQIVDADPDKETLIKSNLGNGAGSLPNRGEYRNSRNEKPLTAFDKITEGLKGLI